ncbi:MAG: hypothetical protein QMD71_03160 [bacterium]|nr:hypothetical protein [bacterium]
MKKIVLIVGLLGFCIILNTLLGILEPSAITLFEIYPRVKPIQTKEIQLEITDNT